MRRKMSHSYRGALAGNSETLSNMEEGDTVGREFNGTSRRQKPTAAEGQRKNALGSYGGRSGPMHYQTQSGLPSPSSGLYMPQSHGAPHAYQQHQSGMPYNQFRHPQLAGSYAGGTSFKSTGTGFDSASNSEFVYDEVTHDQSSNTSDFAVISEKLIAFSGFQGY
jgi:hypothetical protein